MGEGMQRNRARVGPGREAGPGRIATCLERGPVEIEARGDAMAPLVVPGDRVRLERRDPRPGEVALVALEGRLVLQRLLRRRGGVWQVHADRPSAQDAWVHERQVVAIATGRLRRGHRDWVQLAQDRSRLATALERVIERLRRPSDGPR
jgi:hypothetical protein